MECINKMFLNKLMFDKTNINTRVFSKCEILRLNYLIVIIV